MKFRKLWRSKELKKLIHKALKMLHWMGSKRERESMEIWIWR